jgi:hypothetical protein
MGENSMISKGRVADVLKLEAAVRDSAVAATDAAETMQAHWNKVQARRPLTI